MKAFCFALVIFSFASSGFSLNEISRTASAQQKKQREQQNVCFRWACGAIIREGKRPAFVAIESDAMLKAGDKFKMFIELQKKCFVYVIYQSAQGDIRLLFPYELGLLGTNYPLLKQYCIPQDDHWFELDDQPGIETFYLLASAERLTALENLIEVYLSAESTKKQGFAGKILAEIHTLKWRHREFKTFAERPVQIVGGIRGSYDTQRATSCDFTSIAVEISAEAFYSRTFKIDHR